MEAWKGKTKENRQDEQVNSRCPALFVSEGSSTCFSGKEASHQPLTHKHLEKHRGTLTHCKHQMQQGLLDLTHLVRSHNVCLLYDFQNCVGDGQRLKEGNYEKYYLCSDWTDFNKEAMLEFISTLQELQFMLFVLLVVIYC